MPEPNWNELFPGAVIVDGNSNPNAIQSTQDVPAEWLAQLPRIAGVEPAVQVSRNNPVDRGLEVVETGENGTVLLSKVATAGSMSKAQLVEAFSSGVVSQAAGTQQTVATPAAVSANAAASPPTVEVDLLVGSGDDEMRFSGLYHDVVRSDVALVFVWDNRWPGKPVTLGKMAKRVLARVPSLGHVFVILPVGIAFTHDTRQYHVMLIEQAEALPA